MKIIKNVNLKEISPIKIGGNVNEIIYIEIIDELKTLFSKKLPENNDYYLIGNCSNLLFDDVNFVEKFISLKLLNSIKKNHGNFVEIECGATLIKVLNFMRDNNLTGLEKLAGIPATIGGMLYMNAGANKVNIFDNLVSVKTFEDKKIKTLKKNEIDISYRKTSLRKNNTIILSAIFKFESNFNKSQFENSLKSRKKNHPIEFPNIGSIFKNPSENLAAWKLIDDVKLRGFTIGGACFSKKHPNFIINKDKACFQDVISLINLAKQKVEEKFGVKLETEIIIKTK